MNRQRAGWARLVRAARRTALVAIFGIAVLAPSTFGEASIVQHIPTKSVSVEKAFVGNVSDLQLLLVDQGAPLASDSNPALLYQLNHRRTGKIVGVLGADGDRVKAALALFANHESETCLVKILAIGDLILKAANDIWIKINNTIVEIGFSGHGATMDSTRTKRD